jgi:hypothetical protein
MGARTASTKTYLFSLSTCAGPVMGRALVESACLVGQFLSLVMGDKGF